MNTTEEKVMRALKKLNVSYNPVMSGMTFSKKHGTIQMKKKKNIGEQLSRKNSMT